MKNNINYTILKDSEFQVDETKIEHAIYFVSASKGVLYEDKTILIANKLLEDTNFKNVALRASFKLNDPNNLYNELNTLNNDFYTVVYFYESIGELFVINSDALDILNVYLSKNLETKEFEYSRELLEYVLVLCEEDIGIKVIDLNEFN